MKPSTQCLICGNKSFRHLSELFDDRYGAFGKHSIVICQSCGFGKTLPGIPKSIIGEFYAKHYPISKITKQSVLDSISLTNPLKRWLQGTNNIAHHSTVPGEDVLDIGSASGVSLLEIKKLGGSAYGVEPDPSAQRLAKALKLKVYQGFISDNPFPRQQFDLVTASQVIEHEPDPLNFLISIKRKLKSGGRVVLSFPNLNAIYRHVFGRRWLHWHIPYHLNHFTPRSFILLAKRAGFKITKIRTITPNEWTLLQIRMLLQKPIEGKSSNIWCSSSNLAHNQPRPRLVDTTLYILSRLFLIIITPLNRLIDLLGLGESLLVELQNE